MQPKKSLGQNFLIDQNIINKIISFVKATENDIILEIGPGKGDLTKKLVTTKAKIVGIEIDKSMKPYLDKVSSADIIYEDILNINIANILNKYNYQDAYLVANIPYYITTPIIKKIITSEVKFKEIILMVQKELADRFTSLVSDSEYSALTVFLNYHFKIERLFPVSRNAFYPVPKVDSEVIKLTFNQEKPKLKDYPFFEKIVKESFEHRRKTIKNNLKNYNIKIVEEILLKYNLTLNTRPQDLSLEVYVDLANTLYGLK